MDAPRLIAVVGMPGAGKGEVTKYLEEFHKYNRIYFGGITIEKLKEKGLAVNETNEKEMRESLRKEHGMAAYAILSLPKIEASITEGKNTVIDGLYSWEELIFLRNQNILSQDKGVKLEVLAVTASRPVRYDRLSKRPERPLNLDEATSRDISQLENLHTGGPIAFADYIVHNEGTLADLYKAVNDALGIRLRPTWPNYFMQIARTIAMRGTCDRKFIGAVVVDKENQILSTGYNGSIPGQPHCSEVGHDMVNGHCERTIHAEENAILQAARVGVSLKGATIFTTASPCWKCFRGVVRAGINEVVYGELYRDPRIKENADKNNIKLRDFGELTFNELWKRD